MAYIGNKPANKAIVASDLDPAVITGQTALATAPADTDEFLISDAGTLKRIDASLVGGGGKVLQVLSTTKSDTFSTSSTSFTDITGLSVSITPSSTSNKILIIYTVSGGHNAHTFTRLMRDSTAISVGDTAGSRTSATTGNFYENSSGTMSYTYSVSFLDSPSTTSATTYKGQQMTNSGTTYINRSRSDTDANYAARTVSTITVMEIDGT